MGFYNINLIFYHMQYVAAAALASLSGKAPSKESIVAILKATGKPFDQAQVDAVLKAIGTKKVDELISKGLSKVSLGAPAAGSASTPAPAKEEKKKEQPKKKEQKKKEEAPAPPAEEEDFSIDLFG